MCFYSVQAAEQTAHTVEIQLLKTSSETTILHWQMSSSLEENICNKTGTTAEVLPSYFLVSGADL